MTSGIFSKHYGQRKKMAIIKSDPVLHKKYLAKMREYYRRNKDKFKKARLKYHGEMKTIAIELGNCSMCYGEKENHKYMTCSKCREKHRAYYYKRKEKDI